MSYEKVKSIRIDEQQGKVFFNTASNNVRPLSYSIFSGSDFYNNLLKEKGREAVEIEILKEYDEGNLQGGTNKYTKALKVLRYLLKDEYHKFDWRSNWEISKTTRKTQEFKELLKRALNTPFPKEKFIISKDYGGEKVYIRKISSRHAFWTRNKENSRKFNFEEEAKDKKSNFQDNGLWIVEKI